VIVVDEYLAIRSLLGRLPDDLPPGQLAIPTSVHWRLLQRVHRPGTGQLSQALAGLSPAGRAAIRQPDPVLLAVLDPRPLLDAAAAIAAAYGGTGWLIAEAIAAGIEHGSELWFGTERNVGARLREIADDLGIRVRVAG